MAKYDFRILLESVEGQQTSYISQSFVDTSVDLVLSASQVYNRITQFSGSGGAWELDSHATASSGMISCSYQNSPIFSQSSAGTYTTAGVSNADFNDEFTFKDNTLLSASLNGGVVTGSIDFISTPSEDYDRLLRYKFFGEKVCSVLGLPSNQWIYVDQVRFPVDDDSNIFQGNIDVNTAFISNTLTFANNANVNSDMPFYIDTGSDRYIKFIDERSTGSLALIMGYDKDDDLYEISADTEKRFDIKNVDNMINLSRITGSEGVLRVSNAIHIIDDQPTFTLKSKLNDRDFSIINANGAVRLVNSSDSDSVLSDIEIQTAGFDNAVYIDDSADSVGIGTATPDATLHVAGTLKVDGNAEFVGAVTSSIISSSVIFSSGSNIFGDADDDTHTFFGDITASGDISASGKIITPQVGDGNDNLILRGDNVTIQTDASGDIFFKEATTTKFKYDGGEDSFTFTGNITASNNISASGQLIAASADFNDGNITNVGTLKLDELKADTTDEVVISLSGAGMGFNVDGGDVYLFNEGGTDADWKYVDAADVVLIHGDAGLSRVGISDTSPVSKLDVGGDLNVQSHITASGNISSSGTTTTDKLNVNPKNSTSPDMSFGSWNIGYGSTGTEFTGSLTSVGNGYGGIAQFGNGVTIAGRVYCWKPDLTWEVAQANGPVSSSLLGLAMGTHASASGMLLRGVARGNGHDSLLTGQKVYNEANGRIAKGAGADGGDVVRVLGYALSNGTTPAHIYFNPDNTWVEHS